MKRNISTTDRVIRLLIVLVIAYLLFIGKQVALTSTLGIILAVAGVVFLFTALTNWCGVYALLGFSTCSTKSAS